MKASLLRRAALKRLVVSPPPPPLTTLTITAAPILTKSRALLAIVTNVATMREQRAWVAALIDNIGLHGAAV